ncbi:hypothetical protein F4778DRAFT_750916 [Xylariomycetidae sp. FL2044]|nr:hypothetical protein F4778DRAFT_750916 [Xylariomycetidae sp. FL2044]
MSINSQTHYAKIDKSDGRRVCARTDSTNAALLVNLFGSSGDRGPVLKISARGRTGPDNLISCVRRAVHEHYGDDRQVSLGGAFVIRRGTARFHIMPDFPPPEKLPWKDVKEIDDWLHYHDFAAPMVCLTVFHSADARGLGLRMEHTHCFAAEGEDLNRGGHYHYDLRPTGDGEGEEDEEIEYECYLNTAKILYRIQPPAP